MLTAPPSLQREGFALFLDVDGTLLELQAHPSAVQSTTGLNKLLVMLGERLDGALALVSGRSISSLDTIFTPFEFSAAGGHGAELRLPRQPAIANRAELPGAVRVRMQDFAEQHSGLLLELKPAGASLHYRLIPEFEKESRTFMRSLAAELAPTFRLIEGKKVLELVPAGASKGEAISEFLGFPPFAGRRPIFIGDDASDEDGFRVVNALDGMSIVVGDRKPTEAQFRLANVQAIYAWLQEFANQ